MVCIRPGGEEVLSPGRRVMDVWVSNAHCKKVVFTFLPFTFLNIIQLRSFTISSTGPFSICEREGCLLPLKADTNQVHSPIGLPFIGIGNGPFRLTDGSIIVGPGRHFCNFCPADCSGLSPPPQKVKKVKGKKVKSRDLQCAMLFPRIFLQESQRS